MEGAAAECLLCAGSLSPPQSTWTERGATQWEDGGEALVSSGALTLRLGPHLGEQQHVRSASLASASHAGGSWVPSEGVTALRSPVC